MWIINYLHTLPTPGSAGKVGWHCILMNQGWSEWVEASDGFSGLWDWKNAEGTIDQSPEFYEAGEYQITLDEFEYVKSQVDHIHK